MSNQTKSTAAAAGPSGSTSRKSDRGLKSMVVWLGRAYLRALKRNGQSIGQASFFVL